jgi:hypothetical protein
MRLFEKTLLSILLMFGNYGLSLAADRSDTLVGDEGMPSYWRRILSCDSGLLKVQVDLVNQRGMRIVIAGKKNITELRKAGPIGQLQNNGTELVFDQISAFRNNATVKEPICASDFTRLKRRFVELKYDGADQTVQVTSQDSLKLTTNEPPATFKVSFENCVSHGDEDFAGNRPGGPKNQFELLEDALVFAKVEAVINRFNCGVPKE